MFNCFVVPVQLAFAPEWMHNIGFILLNYLIDMLFLIDIFICFKTPYINKFGELETSSELMAKKYINSTFIVDLLATISLHDILQIF